MDIELDVKYGCRLGNGHGYKRGHAHTVEKNIYMDLDIVVNKDMVTEPGTWNTNLEK
jgi:hypothetical protein